MTRKTVGNNPASKGQKNTQSSAITIISEGDRAMRTNVARQLFNLDGSGIRIGVIANSFNALKAAKTDISQGELPGVGNPNGYTQPVQVLKDDFTLAGQPFADEGRAMLQGIHDIAPNAKLLFHSFPFPGSDEDYITAAKALAGAGADIIVDDVGFATAIFQDGAAAQAIDKLTQQGVVIVQAAGNGGTNSYENTFNPGKRFTYQGTTYEAHDFDIGEGTDLFQDMQIPANRSISLFLGWDEPIGNVNSDYQLFFLDRPQLPGTGGQILAQSVSSKDDLIAQPVTTLSYAAVKNRLGHLVIARKQTDNSTLQKIKWIQPFASDRNLDGTGAVYEYVNDRPNATGSSTVFGDQNAKGAIAVGAADFNKTPELRVNPTQIEVFSPTSAAPILFDSQGNRLPTPEIRQKPDIVGPNRIATTVGGAPAFFDPSINGFERFIGTSIAAPQVAAAIALMLQRAGGSGKLTAEQLRTLLKQTATPAVDFRNSPTTAGFIQADAAVIESFLSEEIGTNRGDLLQGTKDADNLSGLAGDDTLMGFQGFDALFGGRGRDTLNGDDGNDYLLGGKGNDFLTGGAGDDFLAGGRGRNQFTGGKGKDIFMLELEGAAVITDFQVDHDRIALPKDLKFLALSINEHESYTVISFSGKELARLTDVRSMNLTPNDFIAG